MDRREQKEKKIALVDITIPFNFKTQSSGGNEESRTKSDKVQSTPPFFVQQFV